MHHWSISPPVKKPPSQRDRGYTNILHHLTKADTKQNDQADKIIKLLKKIMATQEEDAQMLRDVKSGLSDVKSQLSKATDEINAKIQALTDAANNAGSITPELQAAIDDLKPAADALKPIAQTLDDIVPDQAPQAKRKKS